MRTTREVSEIFEQEEGYIIILESSDCDSKLEYTCGTTRASTRETETTKGSHRTKYSSGGKLTDFVRKRERMGEES